MELVVWDFLEMKLIFYQIHHPEFHQNQPYHRQPKELWNDFVNKNNQCYHHHKDNGEEQIKLDDNHFVKMKCKFPDCEMYNKCEKKYHTDNKVTFVLHCPVLLYLKFRVSSRLCIMKDKVRRDQSLKPKHWSLFQNTNPTDVRPKKQFQ